MQKRTILSGILTLALLGAMPAISNAAATQAQQAPAKAEQAVQADADTNAPAVKGERGPRGPKMTAEQREKMEAVFTKYAEKMRPLEDQLFVKKQELRALQNANQPDVQAVSAKAQEIVKLRGELDSLHKEMAKEAGLPMPAWGGPCGGPRNDFPGVRVHHGKRGAGPRGCQPCPGADM